MTSSRFVVAALVGWLFVGLLSAAPQFVPGPDARFGHSMAYDANRQVVVLFGGGTISSGGDFNDLWEWDGASWINRTPSPLPASWPSPRKNGSMVYDRVRGVCVYFGGVTSSSNLDETWEWDGQAWLQRSFGGNTPAPRRYAEFVYDEVQSVSMLYGGYDGSSDYTDTWIYDGSSWVESVVSPHPVGSSVAMAWMQNRDEAVLFGGSWFGNQDQTWSWDGAAWLQSSPANSPAARHEHAMCYDPQLGACVVFGGWGGSTFGDTWTWDGVNWAMQASAVSPEPRWFVRDALVYDEARGECVLFGGRLGFQGAPLGDTWTFDGAEWRPKLDYVTSPVNGNRYALSPEMTWDEAEAFAVAEGGHLATIRNGAENTWLYQAFGSQRWIGYSDAAVEGQWVWSSGEPSGPGTYENWAQGEPNNGTSENYACFWDQFAANGDDWNDYTGTAELGGIIEIVAPVPATASSYGVGCGSPAMVMTPQAPPMLGAAATASIANVPAIPSVPVPLGGVTIGFSDTFYGGLPLLPISLAAAGMPGCELLQSNDIFGLPVAPGSSPGTWDFALPIPANTNLLSTHVYLQAFAGAPGYNAAQFVVSNGVDWLIGNQ